jgi:hypothetical protein
MDLDFILIVVGYLAIVLFLHYYIKINNLDVTEKGKNKPKKILKKEKVRFEDEESLESNNSIEDDDKYMRYLNDEENSKKIDNIIESKKEDTAFDDSLYNKYTADLFKEQSLGSELDKYFDNKSNTSYTFDPVPTTNEDRTSINKEPSTNEILFGNETPLNKENQYDGISAFDEFGSSNLHSQYASI